MIFGLQMVLELKTKTRFTTNGSVSLYYDNSKKFETTGYGITVFGGVNVTGVSTFAGITTVTSSKVSSRNK